MADDLELGLRSIEGEGPSPDFVASLRERLLTEAATPSARTDDEMIVAVEPGPPEQEDRSMIDPGRCRSGRRGTDSRPRRRGPGW